ncbi:MAG: hypothetical protein CTY33_01200 [Methylotenera sp.]|nr:MAG: hypothetical protein CTY33_01200 [Methylotenera sp.]
MVTQHLYKAILLLLNARKNKILTYAKVGLSESQYIAFRSLVLDELGQKGLESELSKLLGEGNHSVKNGNGRE